MNSSILLRSPGPWLCTTNKSMESCMQRSTSENHRGTEMDGRPVAVQMWIHSVFVEGVRVKVCGCLLPACIFRQRLGYSLSVTRTKRAPLPLTIVRSDRKNHTGNGRGYLPWLTKQVETRLMGYLNTMSSYRRGIRKNPLARMMKGFRV